ncbi:hypothetical protein [[Eubacterium] cellulosolvens]
MNEKAIAGIILLVIGLVGIMLFFPIYSPTFYGGWGCPMMGGRGSGHMMGGGFYGGGLAAMVLLDIFFVVILLIGIYFIWKSTQSTS